MDEMDLELARLALRNTHNPHSYPLIEGDRLANLVSVPGDPTSSITVDALAMDPEDRDCMMYLEAGEDFYLTAAYYRERGRASTSAQRDWRQ